MSERSARTASETLAAWASTLAFEDLPSDVVQATRWRVLDILGLALAGAETPFGRSVLAAERALAGGGTSRVFGHGDRLTVPAAAVVNGAFLQALEYDDTHVESIVHMSGPSIVAALALADTRSVSGRRFVTAVALGNEVSSRVGSVSPGQFHRRGFHPTGLFAPFGVSYLTCWLLGLDAEAMVRAAGTCGSFAAGILQCWVDGTDTKYLHSGWAAQSGLTAAFLAQAGTTGPREVFEGRFGLFASHLQEPDVPRDFARVTGDLGTRWESRYASFKPYPAAHVLHPYIDVALRLRREHGIAPAEIERVDCPVAEFIVPIVCEPVEEKVAPASSAHARVSLQYSVAEALWHGHLGRRAYAHLEEAGIRALAERVHYQADPDFPGPGQFKGLVRLTLRDGRVVEAVQQHSRGTLENPMSEADLRAKFEENAEGLLDADARSRLAAAVDQLESLPDVRVLMDLAVRSGAE